MAVGSGGVFGRVMRAVGAVVLAGMVLAGCSAQRVYPLTDRTFPPTPAGQEIKLYTNAIRRPHLKLAYVQSTSDVESSPESRVKQLEQLREQARALGADAVVEVRELKNKVRGAVPDEAVPFRAYRQGRYNLYFLRGTAVRFVEPGEEAEAPEASAVPPAPGQGPAGSIPSVTTRDPEEEAPMETVPRGLGPL